MDKNLKVIGGLSRKARVNIFITVFLIFIIIAVLSSFKQISNIVISREKIVELEEKLNYQRQENIKMLAEEKALYNEELIESEARNQFNMTKGEETNYFVKIDEERDSIDLTSETLNTLNNESFQESEKKLYEESNLWENIKILYNNEIKN